jgi:hypothetical protein
MTIKYVTKIFVSYNENDEKDVEKYFKMKSQLIEEDYIEKHIEAVNGFISLVFENKTGHINVIE